MFLVAVLMMIPLEPIAPTLEGWWRNPSHSVVVAIAPCGGAMCGQVEWASEQAQADARRGGTDPLIGVEVLSSLKSKGDGRWKGRLFVPDIKKRSKAELRLLGSDQLKVTGCAVGRLVCKSEIWTRTDAQSR